MTAMQDNYIPQVITDLSTEFRAITQEAALHDSSRAGRLRGTGLDLLDLLHRLSTNAVKDLQPGQGAPAILTTDRGRILDVIGVVNLGDWVLLLTSPGAQQAVLEWLDKYTIMEDLTLADATGETAQFTALGPQAREKLAAAGVDVADLPPYHARAAAVAGQAAHIIASPLGELPAWEVVTAAEAAPAVWQGLLASGFAPVGAAALEAARVRYGAPQLGRELGEAYNPLEAGLIGAVDFQKGCYIGQEVIARLDAQQRVQKFLVRLRFSPGAAPPSGTPLLHEGREVGSLTSVAAQPDGGEALGLGYVRRGSQSPGTRLTLAGGKGEAEIIDLPLFFGPEKP